MATIDGSGDIGFSVLEMKLIVQQMQEAIAHASPDDLHVISVGITKAGVVVNIRPPRHRGPIEEKGFIIQPYGSSNL